VIRHCFLRFIITISPRCLGPQSWCWAFPPPPKPPHQGVPFPPHYGRASLSNPQDSVRLLVRGGSSLGATFRRPKYHPVFLDAPFCLPPDPFLAFFEPRNRGSSFGFSAAHFLKDWHSLRGFPPAFWKVPLFRFSFPALGNGPGVLLPVRRPSQFSTVA